MKRTILIVCSVLAVIAVLALSWVGDGGVIAQVGSTPRLPGVYWDKYWTLEEVDAPELVGLFVDLEVRCDDIVVLSQVLDLNGPAFEIGEGLFRECEWSWGGWTPPAGAMCIEWRRTRWEVPAAAGAVLGGVPFAGQLFGEYWPEEGQETWEDGDHFWRVGPLADGEWYEFCPGAPDCATPLPTLTPRPTLTPVPEPTCRLTPTCPGVTPWPTEPPWPTATPWPTQPPF